jgi:amino acid transporter
VQLGAMSALPDLSQSKTPIASAAQQLVGPIGAYIVTIGALLSMAGTNSGTMLEGSRMLYALSLGRRMGTISYVHPRFRTPTVAIAIHTIVALALALGGSFRQLALISAMARLTTYLVTCLAIPRLRKLNASQSQDGFRTPGYIIPALGVLVSMVFVVNLDRMKLLVAAIALTAGALLYVASRTKEVPTA